MNSGLIFDFIVYFPVVAGGAALIFTSGLVPVAPMALGLLGIGKTINKVWL